MNVACHLCKFQMVAECPHFQTPQCETQTTRWKDKTKSFWTKAILSAYLRSCSCTGRLIDSVYISAKNGDSDCPFPAAWSDPLIFSKCLYAPMHMLFLGHVRSDIDMVSKWLGHYEILAMFGKQENMYIHAVRNLRANRYFPAHSFSSVSWGTGVWVSENYLFWG